MSGQTDLSYFPGCSLATTAKENNQSLVNLCHRLGYNLNELEDWNCCGSSSTHSIDADLAFDLATRNLSLAPPGRPLVVACPSCNLRLQHALHTLKNDENARGRYEETWGKPPDVNLEIIHFFELLDQAAVLSFFKENGRNLGGIKFVPYYGCMLARPPALNHNRNYHGLMEKILSSLGAVPLPWSYASRCCGTFLAVAKPDAVTPMVNDIIRGAVRAGADCIVTACAMCHLNLEVRCNLKEQIPVFHFSEVLALALDAGVRKDWFSRHLVDPRPLLKVKQLIT